MHKPTHKAHFDARIAPIRSTPHHFEWRTRGRLSRGGTRAAPSFDIPTPCELTLKYPVHGHLGFLEGAAAAPLCPFPDACSAEPDVHHSPTSVPPTAPQRQTRPGTGRVKRAKTRYVPSSFHVKLPSYFEQNPRRSRRQHPRGTPERPPTHSSCANIASIARRMAHSGGTRPWHTVPE